MRVLPSRGPLSRAIKWEEAMRTHLTVALSMLAGIGVGAIAVQGLHAQGKPSVYLVTEIDVTDPDNYSKEFAPKAQTSIRNAGGRFVVIGGVAGAGKRGESPGVWDSRR